MLDSPKAPPSASDRQAKRPAGEPTLALALGGGGARGLSHILILEALDELGVRPTVIAGTSIGALIGGAYASGMSAAEIRDHCSDLFQKRSILVRRFLRRWDGKLVDIWGSVAPPIAAADRLLKALMPHGLAETFGELQIPLMVVTTDFYAQEPMVIEQGPLLPALTASAALPSLMRPIEIDGRLLIDGGFVNPLPFDLLAGRADVIAAIDVSAGGLEARPSGKSPPFIETLIGAMQISLRSIIQEKLLAGAPDILIRPNVSPYKVLDFFKFEEIIANCADCKDEFKRAIDARLTAA
jgi:NTE family protein